MYTESKLCKKCYVAKPIDQFYSYRHTCKECYKNNNKQKDQTFYCVLCKKNILESNKTMHYRTKKHQT